MGDEERIDGRDLIMLDEPGSDALLLLGLIRLLAKTYAAVEHRHDP